MSKPLSRLNWWQQFVVALTESATLWLLGFLICRDGWNGADLGMFLSGAVIGFAGVLSLAAELVPHERQRRIRLLSYWFIGGGFVTYIVTLFF